MPTGASPPDRTGTLAFWAIAPGRDLVAELVEDLRPRADERDPGLGTGPGERGVLGQEAVAGVDGIDPDVLGQLDDAGDVEVRADRLAGLADPIGLVGLEAVQGEAVLVGVDRDGADAEFVGRAEDADGDLAAVGDEQLLERRDWARPDNLSETKSLACVREFVTRSPAPIYHRLAPKGRGSSDFGRASRDLAPPDAVAGTLTWQRPLAVTGTMIFG